MARERELLLGREYAHRVRTRVRSKHERRLRERDLLRDHLHVMLLQVRRCFRHDAELVTSERIFGENVDQVESDLHHVSIASTPELATVPAIPAGVAQW